MSLYDNLKEFFERAQKGDRVIVAEEEVNKLTKEGVADINALINTYILNPAKNEFTMMRGGNETVYKRVTDRPADAGVFTDPAAAAQRTLADHTPTTPFRPRYRKLSDKELALHDLIKQKATELLDAINEVPLARTDPTDGEGMANLKLSFRHLEDAVYRAVKALTA